MYNNKLENFEQWILLRFLLNIAYAYSLQNPLFVICCAKVQILDYKLFVPLKIKSLICIYWILYMAFVLCKGNGIYDKIYCNSEHNFTYYQSQVLLFNSLKSFIYTLRGYRWILFLRNISKRLCSIRNIKLYFEITWNTVRK